MDFMFGLCVAVIYSVLLVLAIYSTKHSERARCILIVKDHCCDDCHDLVCSDEMVRDIEGGKTPPPADNKRVTPVSFPCYTGNCEICKDDGSSCGHECHRTVKS